MMSEWEKIIDAEIREWYYKTMVVQYQSREKAKAYAKPWLHLFDEELQMYAELFWETKLKD
jgi:hypothetical protein